MDSVKFDGAECAMPSCTDPGLITCVCCMHAYCNWHGRDYLKVTTMGTMCSDCMFCFIHELKGLMY
mgnify:FL=1